MIAWDKVITFIKASRSLQLVLVFVAGGAVATVFYPTKHIKETIQKSYEEQIATLNQQHEEQLDQQQQILNQVSSEYHSYHDESEQKIASLTTQVTTLTQHQKQSFWKIVHPDGTVEERATSSSDSEEEQQVSQQVQAEYQQKLQDDVTKLEQIQADKISSMQKEWDSKEQSYQQQISTMSQTKTIITNPKNLGLELGILTDLNYYGHVTYDVWGPFFIGVQGQFGSNSMAGAGIGIRF